MHPTPSRLCVLGLLLPLAACATSTANLPRSAAPSANDAWDALERCATELHPHALKSCTLFAGLFDLRQLARLPVPDYASHMASSFDRASATATPAEPAWFANRDFAVLSPDRPEVLLDVDGPGVITRIWSANPAGVLRVYLDGAAQPALEAPMRALLSGEFAQVSSAFSFLAAGGGNLYLPIAYQRHCKITVESSAKRLYYQVNYRSYGKDVQVEPFDLAALSGETSWAARALAGGAWQSHGEHRPITLRSADAKEHSPSVSMPNGGVVRALRLTPSATDPDSLRQSVLHVWVDGEETVRAPLGDFFGTGPGLQPVAALPVHVDSAHAVLESRWPMPFQHELRIGLERRDGPPLTAAGELLIEPAPFGADTLLFHARGRAPEWHANEPTHEYTLSQISGDGVYVGTLLNVTNGEAAWWGEGDEKIWLDDDAFPSMFGTGTEDYFGYAYCSNERFSRPYIGQTLAGVRANYGRISLYRFHVPDPLRFRKQLRFDLEVNHWSKSGALVAYDSVAFFYARPGAGVAESGAQDAPSVPALSAPEPLDVPEGPYTCG